MLAFAVVAGLMTLVPGIDTAIVLRTAVQSGRKAAYAAGFGVAVGLFVWAAAAAVGVSQLVTASPAAYAVLRNAGAAYMLWLAYKMMRAKPHNLESEASAAPDARVAFTRGFMANLLNPKIGAFYVAVLPQFLPADTNYLLSGLALGLVHVTESLIWFSVLILATHVARGFLARPRAQRVVDIATGIALFVLAVRVALNP